MITDDNFRSELEIIFKQRKMLKKERSEKIGELLLLDSVGRDDIVDYEQSITNQYLSTRIELKRIPTEHSEQANFVHWFRCTYPGVKIAAIPNGGNRSGREAAALVLEGVSPGIPDIIIPEWMCWIEFKRIKGGVLSEEQIEWRNYILSINQTHILAYGFEDAKKQINELKCLIV